MRRKLTNREKGMISILALLLIFMVYNQLVLQPFTKEMSSIQKSKYEVEDALQVEMFKGVRLQLMKNQLAELNKDSSKMTTITPTYDNSQNLITELAVILTGVTDYNLNFSQIKEEGALVRRTIGISFTCASYEKAGQIMKQLASSRYRCRITDYSIIAKNLKTSSDTATVQAPDITKDTVQVSIMVVFYELKAA